MSAVQRNSVSAGRGTAATRSSDDDRDVADDRDRPTGTSRRLPRPHRHRRISSSTLIGWQPAPGHGRNSCSPTSARTTSSSRVCTGPSRQRCSRSDGRGSRARTSNPCRRCAAGGTRDRSRRHRRGSPLGDRRRVPLCAPVPPSTRTRRRPVDGNLHAHVQLRPLTRSLPQAGAPATAAAARFLGVRAPVTPTPTPDLR